MGSISNPENSGASQGARPSSAVARVLGVIEYFFLNIGVVCILAISLYISAGIILRSLSMGGLPDETVVVGDLMLGVVVLPLGYVAADRGFIAVELLTARAGPKMQAWLNVFAALIGIGVGAFIASAGFQDLVESVGIGDYYFGRLSIPTWPGKLAFFLGYLGFILRLIYQLAQDTRAGFGHPTQRH